MLMKLRDMLDNNIRAESMAIENYQTAINRVKNQINQERNINHKRISKRSMVVQMFGKASQQTKVRKEAET